MSNDHYDHGRIHHLLRGRLVTKAEIEDATGWTPRKVDDVLGRMRHLGMVARVGHMHWTRTNGAPNPAPESERRLLPVLEDGYGNRRDDCQSYGDCLGRFTQRRPFARCARCPASCDAYAPTSREQLLAEATVRTRSQGSP